MAVIRDSVVYVGGEILAKIMPFLLLPYLSSKLGVNDYGQLALYQTYMTLIFVIISYSQNSAISRYFYRYGHRGVPAIFISGSVLTILTSIPLIILFVFNESSLFLVILISSIFQTLVFNYLAILQCHKQSISYVLIQLFINLAIVLFVFLQFEYIGVFIGAYFNAFLLAYFLAFLFLFYKRDRKAKVVVKSGFKYARFLVSFGAPLIIHQLCLFVKGGADRLIVGNQYTEYELGVYAMAFQVSSILQVFFIALNRAALPYYYNALKVKSINESDILKYARICMLFPLITSLFVIFLPESLFLYVLGEEFVGIKYFVSIFIFGVSINAIYFTLINYFFYFGRTKFIAKANLISAIVHVILVFLFSFISVKMIAFSLIVSNMILCLILYFDIKKQGKLNVS